jgi:hypothetical protein
VTGPGVGTSDCENETPVSACKGTLPSYCVPLSCPDTPVALHLLFISLSDLIAL